MITSWNRHEVYAGFDMNHFNQILDLLASKKIKYKYRTVSQTSRGRGIGQSSRAHYGTAGINLNFAIMYYIYVHKKDAELVSHLLHRQF